MSQIPPPPPPPPSPLIFESVQQCNGSWNENEDTVLKLN